MTERHQDIGGGGALPASGECSLVLQCPLESLYTLIHMPRPYQQIAEYPSAPLA